MFSWEREYKKMDALRKDWRFSCWPRTQEGHILPSIISYLDFVPINEIDQIYFNAIATALSPSHHLAQIWGIHPSETNLSHSPPPCLLQSTSPSWSIHFKPQRFSSEHAPPFASTHAHTTTRHSCSPAIPRTPPTPASPSTPHSSSYQTAPLRIFLSSSFSLFPRQHPSLLYSIAAHSQLL